MRLLPRSALLAILLPLLYLGTASATFLYRIHAGHGDSETAVLRVAETPRATDRILIFSPHPDDEALACGGLIAQARRAGAAVDVVFLTNGDGFRVAVQRQYRLLRVEPEDYVRFAALRQSETRRALGVLGVSAQHAHFLGFADRGLQDMWTDHWWPDNPYVSPYTKRDRPAGGGTSDKAVFCGRDVEAEVEAKLRELKPTVVYVTHPSDDHIDHMAASAFVTRALLHIQEEGLSWAKECRLRYYVVHRGDWPVPGGLHTEQRLLPPSEMVGLDSRWYLLTLDAADVSAKTKAVQQYGSQTAIMKAFLLSFARRTEPQAEIDPVDVPQVPDGRIELDGKPADWSGLSPVILDPVNDNLLRDFQRGGDIGSVYACKDGGKLYLRVDTYRAASQGISMRVLIRAFDTDGQPGTTRFVSLRLPPGAQRTAEGVVAVQQGTMTEIGIPMARIHGAASMALSVETTFAGMLVDRTGYRFLRLR